MGKFTNKILAEFQPPKKWKLGRDLVYTTSDLYANEVKALKDVGVAVVRDTNKTETITVPSGFITDLASTPRILWNVIAPFDVARAAIVHDLLYKSIRQYRWSVGLIEEDKELIKNAKVAADKVFLLAMKDAEPKVSKWKIYCAWKAVDLFGRWSIIPNKGNI
jgi:ABC-type ATPase involved in cell division